MKLKIKRSSLRSQQGWEVSNKELEDKASLRDRSRHYGSWRQPKDLKGVLRAHLHIIFGAYTFIILVFGLISHPRREPLSVYSCIFS